MVTFFFFFFGFLSPSTITPTPSHTLTYTRGVIQQDREKSTETELLSNHTDALNTYMNFEETTLSDNFLMENKI